MGLFIAFLSFVLAANLGLGAAYAAESWSYAAAASALHFFMGGVVFAILLEAIQMVRKHGRQ